eukprot:jgi/Mesvir1/10138/Mv06767-RA.1
MSGRKGARPASSIGLGDAKGHLSRHYIVGPRTAQAANGLGSLVAATPPIKPPNPVQRSDSASSPGGDANSPRPSLRKAKQRFVSAAHAVRGENADVTSASKHAPSDGQTPGEGAGGTSQGHASDGMVPLSGMQRDSVFQAATAVLQAQAVANKAANEGLDEFHPEFIAAEAKKTMASLIEQHSARTEQRNPLESDLKGWLKNVRSRADPWAEARRVQGDLVDDDDAALGDEDDEPSGPTVEVPSMPGSHDLRFDLDGDAGGHGANPWQKARFLMKRQSVVKALMEGSNARKPSSNRADILWAQTVSNVSQETSASVKGRVMTTVQQHMDKLKKGMEEQYNKQMFDRGLALVMARTRVRKLLAQKQHVREVLAAMLARKWRISARLRATTRDTRARIASLREANKDLTADVQLKKGEISLLERVLEDVTHKLSTAQEALQQERLQSLRDREGLDGQVAQMSAQADEQSREMGALALGRAELLGTVGQLRSLSDELMRKLEGVQSMLQRTGSPASTLTEVADARRVATDIASVVFSTASSGASGGEWGRVRDQVEKERGARQPALSLASEKAAAQAPATAPVAATPSRPVPATADAPTGQGRESISAAAAPKNAAPPIPGNAPEATASGAAQVRIMGGSGPGNTVPQGSASAALGEVPAAGASLPPVGAGAVGAGVGVAAAPQVADASSTGHRSSVGADGRPPVPPRGMAEREGGGGAAARSPPATDSNHPGHVSADNAAAMAASHPPETRPETSNERDPPAMVLRVPSFTVKPPIPATNAVTSSPPAVGRGREEAAASAATTAATTAADPSRLEGALSTALREGNPEGAGVSSSTPSRRPSFSRTSAQHRAAPPSSALASSTAAAEAVTTVVSSSGAATSHVDPAMSTRDATSGVRAGKAADAGPNAAAMMPADTSAVPPEAPGRSGLGASQAAPQRRPSGILPSSGRQSLSSSLDNSSSSSVTAGSAAVAAGNLSPSPSPGGELANSQLQAAAASRQGKERMDHQGKERVEMNAVPSTVTRAPASAVLPPASPSVAENGPLETPGAGPASRWAWQTDGQVGSPSHPGGAAYSGRELQLMERVSQDVGTGGDFLHSDDMDGGRRERGVHGGASASIIDEANVPGERMTDARMMANGDGILGSAPARPIGASDSAFAGVNQELRTDAVGSGASVTDAGSGGGGAGAAGQMEKHGGVIDAADGQSAPGNSLVGASRVTTQTGDPMGLIAGGEMGKGQGKGGLRESAAAVGMTLPPGAEPSMRSLILPGSAAGDGQPRKGTNGDVLARNGRNNLSSTSLAGTPGGSPAPPSSPGGVASIASSKHSGGTLMASRSREDGASTPDASRSARRIASDSTSSKLPTSMLALTDLYADLIARLPSSVTCQRCATAVPLANVFSPMGSLPPYVVPSIIPQSSTSGGGGGSGSDNTSQNSNGSAYYNNPNNPAFFSSSSLSMPAIQGPGSGTSTPGYPAIASEHSSASSPKHRPHTGGRVTGAPILASPPTSARKPTSISGGGFVASYSTAGANASGAASSQRPRANATAASGGTTVIVGVPSGGAATVQEAERDGSGRYNTGDHGNALLASGAGGGSSGIRRPMSAYVATDVGVRAYQGLSPNAVLGLGSLAGLSTGGGGEGELSRGGNRDGAGVMVYGGDRGGGGGGAATHEPRWWGGVAVGCAQAPVAAVT